MFRVSIIMATYNGARFIEEQLKSLASQKLQPFELVVSDDGSTDQTLELVRSFQVDAPFPVIVQRNEWRLGYGENFLQAAKLASGDLIAFCDQDDIWHPDKLNIAAEGLNRTNAELFAHAAVVIDHNDQTTGFFTQGITQNKVCAPLTLGPWAVLYGCSMVFPRRLIDLVDAAERGGHTFEHDGLLSHDLWIYFLASSLGTVMFDARPLIKYRQHGENATPKLSIGRARAWSKSLGLSAHPLLRRCDIARHRAAVMMRLSESTGDTRVAEQAMVAAVYWRRIGNFEDMRLALYTECGFFRRVFNVAHLVRSGAYRSVSHGALGGRLLLKDILFAVLQINSLPKGISRSRAILSLRK